MWDNRETYNGISVLPYDGGTYIQAPFENITEEEYNRLNNPLHSFDITKVGETNDNTNLAAEAACAGGACEIGDFV
jgi:ribonucleoside-diphosphate reductase alpha chain